MPRNLDLSLIGIVTAVLVVALVVALVATSVVKSLVIRVKAMDVPKDDRRMRDHPIPHTSGLTILLGSLLSILLSLSLNAQMRGVLLEAVTVVVLGISDGTYPLRVTFKSVAQITAALVAMLSSNVIEILPNPSVFSADPYWNLGILAVPVAIIWTVVITNAASLIDGLDDLIYDVSTISSMTLLVIALAVSEGNVVILMAALAGGCIGFLPYDMSPVKIFMGDMGSTFLDCILAMMSIQGLFKSYTIISFTVPFLMLGLSIFDACFVFVRRIVRGQSPMHADRSRVHHRLIDMDLNQKQTVAALYIISAVLSLFIVVLTTSGPVKAMLLLLALYFARAISVRILLGTNGRKNGSEELDKEGEEK